MRTRKLAVLTGALVMGLALNANAASILEMALKGAAIGFAVTKAAEPLDKAINTITLQRGVPTNLDTKVVPILSVGEKGYIGGAQVAGPKALVDQVKAVFQYENNLSTNQFRVKALVPSSSLNPLQLKRVQKVGISALIDVSLSGGLHNSSEGRALTGGDVLKAGAIAVAVKNLDDQINSVINKVTFNKGVATRVTPMASFGDKAYIGGAQVSGSASVIDTVNAVWQFEGLYGDGKFRVKALVPTTSSNPLKLKRVHGAGITAVIDSSLRRQTDPEKDRLDALRAKYLPYGRNGYYNEDRNRSRDDRDEDYRKDNGKHKGWYKGKHKGWFKNGKISLPDDYRDD